MRWVLACAVAAGCSFAPAAVTSDAASDAMRDGSTMLQCPSTYDVTVAASTSQYRVIVSGGSFATQHADCNDDQPGVTHLASLETSAEISALQTYVAALAVSAP